MQKNKNKNRVFSIQIYIEIGLLVHFSINFKVKMQEKKTQKRNNKKETMAVGTMGLRETREVSLHQMVRSENKTLCKEGKLTIEEGFVYIYI